MGDQQEKGDLRSQGAAMQGSDALTEPQRLWVEALRSGKYPQGRQALCHIDGDETVDFCCLGVACEVAIAAGLTVRVDTRFGGRRSYDGCSLFLPPTVAQWLGLADDNGACAGGSLSNRNDSGATFSDIADLIERRPRGLFA